MHKRNMLIGLFILFSVIALGGFLSGCSSEKKDTSGAEMITEESAQLWTCGMHPEVIVDEPGQCPKCGMNLVPVKNTSESSQPKTADTKPNGERKILYWQAPMNPTEIYDKPGKSAMGMDLIPVYEGDEQSSSGAISIDPVTVQNMGVRYGTVSRMDFHHEIRTVGKVDYNEDKLYEINTKMSGWIERLFVDYTGEMVNAGQPLMEIYSPELVTTQQEYLLALKTREMVRESRIASIREGGETLLESTRKRLLYWDVPKSELERLENTGEVKKTVLLRAQSTGMVIEKNAIEGGHIKEGMKLFQIADLREVWVHASIYDYEVPWIVEGQTAEMTLSYQPGKTYTGRVSYIYPFLREKARDVHVRLEFQNPDLELKPGMYVNVQLHGKVIPDALVIPIEAVIRSGKRNVVFVTREPGKFEPRDIQIGEEGGPNNRNVRVISGLLEGEQVVISAQFLLDSESRLQEAIQKMLKERQGGKKPSMEQDQMDGMNSSDDHQHQMGDMNATDEHNAHDTSASPSHDHGNSMKDPQLKMEGSDHKDHPDLSSGQSN